MTVSHNVSEMFSIK